MKRAVLFFHGCLLALSVGWPVVGLSKPAGAGPGAKAAGKPATLRWNNGESLEGEPAEADETALTWQTALFEDPLLLAWGALHRIDQTPAASKGPAEPFAFSLRDGSHLYGDLAGVSAEVVTLHSARHGDLALRRAEVLSVRRIRGKRLTYAGPLGEAGWVPAQSVMHLNGDDSAMSATLGDVPTRTTGAGGSVVIPFFHRAIRLEMPLPTRMDVEFHVRAEERPNFRLALDNGTKQRLRIETWGDELVLAAGDGFETVRTLDPAEREVALRVCWDRQTRRCQVYTPEGLLLKEWTVPEERGSAYTGVRLDNQSRALTLDFLRVREWDGQPPVAVDRKQPRVETDDGQVTAGNVTEVSAGVVSVSPGGEGMPATVPLADVDAMFFANDLPEVATDGTTLTYGDGTLLHGKLAGIKDGSAMVQTRVADAPVPTKMEGWRQVLLGTRPGVEGAAEPALASLDKIVLGERTLHGKLVCSGEAQPRWLPVGGQRAATPARTLDSEITRVLAPVASGQDPAGGTSLFYTRTGDVLPGTLHGLDRQAVEFDSPVVATKSLPTAEVEAVQFDAANVSGIQGFDAPGWQVVKGAKDEIQKGDALHLGAESVVGHPAAMQEGEVRFTFASNQYACLRLRLFCDGLDPAKALNFVLFRIGNTMTTGVESEEEQFASQNRTAIKSGPVSVRLVVEADRVQCFLNDGLVETLPYAAEKRAGTGLVFEPSSMWGNGVQRVELTQFAEKSRPGQTFLPEINPNAKAQVLTVPRFRKDDPPHEVLVAANGDLLRGEIEAITNTQIGFRVGLETLKVPRARVKAVLALGRPVDAPAVPAEEDPTKKLLEKRVEQKFWYNRATLKMLIGVLEREAPELKFRLPTETKARQQPFHFDGGTVAETLDSICETFELHHRVDKGVIVIEGKPQDVSEAMVTKAYWLKPDAFSEKDAATDALAARGIAFPNGASATWQGGAQCLAMVNTAANQAKLVELLNRDYGGVVGSPTHWLRLTNGGRLGLTVEAFDPQMIRGTHPVYGACNVPMSEVYAIRNTLPEPTAAGRAVSGWQPVYAPEPLLPDGGGDTSALVGKNAPTFKLALLDGGDFDLAQERGHIVVLDFWATWCGPCIESLPGLIETMAPFPADRVKFVGVNQAEGKAQVKRFLDTRGWKLAVAMDAGQTVGQQYGADAIPCTVVVGPDGKVASVRNGYAPGGEADVAAEVNKLLAANGQPTVAPVTPTPKEGAAGSP